MVIRVEEPATCEYIISIHSKSLCSHPAFKVEETVKKVSLVCAPILTPKVFKKFKEEQKKRKEKEEEKIRSQQGNVIIFIFFFPSDAGTTSFYFFYFKTLSLKVIT